MTKTTKQTTKRAVEYIIYRHGSNAANQSMRKRMPVAFVTALSAEEAVASCDEGLCYANQHLRAQPVSRASAAAVRELQEDLARMNGRR